MEWVFAAFGIASIGYGLAIYMHNGLTSFIWFWPLFALAHFIVFGICVYLKNMAHKKVRINIRPYVFLLSTYGAAIFLALGIMAAIYSESRAEERPNLDYVIVMGTDLRHNKISPSMQIRLDRAVNYAQKNRHTIFILSGGKGEYDRTTQATAMYYYMVQRGVPAGNLLIEFYSRSTLEKIGFSIETILEDQEDRNFDVARAGIKPPWPKEDEIIAETRPLSVGIITSDFNVLRAMRMAENFGLRDVCPMGTPSDSLMTLHLYVREAAAIFKDRIVGNI